MTQRIVLASNNPNKAREFGQLLKGSGIEIVPQSHFQVPEADETGLTFVENAILKARNASAYSELPAIADDSGLEVDALGGEPGIHSARFAGDEASDADNNALLLERLRDLPDEKRTARFQCLLVFLRHEKDPTPIICQGTWEGRILYNPQGENGFGYDPLFFVPEKGCSAAELPAEVKNALSHRGKALRCLVERLTSWQP